MEYRPLDITVISAEGLKDVNFMSKMDVYVIVSIAGDHLNSRRSPVDKDGGKSPKWNHSLKLSVDETALSRNPNLCLTFKLRSERPLGDRDIGEVAVPIRELLDKIAVGDGSERVVEYQVRTTSGKPKGTLKFSYKFEEKVTAPVAAATPKTNTKSNEPVTAYPHPPGVGYAPPPTQMAAPYTHAAWYPPPPPGAGYGYPGPQPVYGAGYPPAGPSYGYPQQGYGYPQVVQQQPQKKKNNFGLGLGAGLLGGLLVGDMISVAGDMAANDSGYDTGFDDGAFGF